MSALDEFIAALTSMPKEEAEKIAAEAYEATKGLIWVPNPGPQAEAYFSEADELFYGGSAGGGKGLALDTPIPTRSGWKSMGEISVGDEIFDCAGKPCKVNGVSKINMRPCYRLTFDDGSTIVADDVHRWVTLNAKELSALTALDSIQLGFPTGTMRDTSELSATLQTKSGRNNHAIPVSDPLCITEDIHLDVPPYTLGAWLGYGSSENGRFTGIDMEIWERVERDGFEVRHYAWSDCSHSIFYDTAKYRIGLKVKLREIGVLENKHIPPKYLRASYGQRLSLLQGLMDTDGHATPNGKCEFDNTNEALANGVYELATSLGIKATKTHGKAKLNGRVTCDKWRVSFTTSLPVFLVQRKAARLKKKNRRTVSFRYLVGCDLVDSVPTKCISVDSESRQYLAGKAMIPTHNTDLAIGLALTQHRRSLVLRKFLDDARDMAERMLSIVGNKAGWNGQLLHYRQNHLSIDFAGCRNDDEKQRFKGKPHDLKVFDEIGDFPESVYTFITTWTRSAAKGQRCRIVCTGNPPTEPEGLWVIKRWGAWLDPAHPNPAKDGELRWYTNIDGQDTEVDGPGPHNVDGKMVYAKSRTFIRAVLQDNPDLTQDRSYEATLDSLPEEYRLAYRDGRFDLGLRDKPFQAIPTDWIRAAQERWHERVPAGIPMCAMGVDCSGGGNDPMIIAIRHDGWYAPLVEIPGKDMPKDRLGRFAAGQVVSYRRDNAHVIVDMGGGYGGSLYETLRENHIEVISHKGAEASTRRTKDGQLGFANKRSEVIWLFREALDPSQQNGSPIFLPPDPKLMADLAAPAFKLVGGKIAIEPKEEVCKRLGRSTDRGDAVVEAWSAGPTYITDQAEWAENVLHNTPLGRTPRVVMGRQKR